MTKDLSVGVSSLVRHDTWPFPPLGGSGFFLRNEVASPACHATIALVVMHIQSPGVEVLILRRGHSSVIVHSEHQTGTLFTVNIKVLAVFPPDFDF